jgi:short subunit dehydrogenase-like uncharacterized protein
LETMQLKYSEQAEQNGVFVIGSCGFDSIPSDLGGAAVHKAMEGPVNKVSRKSKFLTVIFVNEFDCSLVHLGSDPILC